MKAKKLVDYLAGFFDVKNIKDSALNGLQVESAHQEIKKITLAVDFSLPAVKKAKENRSQWLFVHHGLVWHGLQDITGLRYTYISELIKNNIALYACHLPLDLHPKVGHNIELCRLLKLKNIKPFGTYQDTLIGFCGELKEAKSINTVSQELKNLLKSDSIILPFGKKKIKTIGIVSGGAADIALQAKEKELDLFISGESSHSFYNQIKDSKINVIFCGHYATETLGLKKMAKHLKEKFGLNYEWFDNPTGL